MSRAGPFEPAPRLAIAVSGGADSMALAILADGWAKSRGGKVVALTVDHRLRRGSGAEARLVASRLRARRMEHHVLRRPGRRLPRPESNLQAAARAARYGLLEGWCRRHGVLHLLLAHHLEDQAETVLLRLGRGSGVDGLAAMAGVSETPYLRLVRPLLSVPKERLRAVLAARRVNWIEDPSNRDPSYARVRVRQAATNLARLGLDAARLAATARNMARARAALEGDTAALVAGSAMVSPAGYCTLDRAGFEAASAELSLRALSRILMCVGGGEYPPRLHRLERVCGALRAGDASGRTLAGCRLLIAGDTVLVVREARAASQRLRISGRGEIVWDQRFRLVFRAPRQGLTVAALGSEGWSQLAAEWPDLRNFPVPAPARATLPAIFDRRGVVLVPHLGYGRDLRGAASVGLASIEFAPPHPLAGAAFAIV